MVTILTPEDAAVADGALLVGARTPTVQLTGSVTGAALHDALVVARDTGRVLVIDCADRDTAAGYLPALALLSERIDVDVTVILHPTATGTQVRAVTPRTMSQRFHRWLTSPRRAR